MTTLEKLGILGIRSFGTSRLETLTFQKPLTLIVGHNGAGKTTIVECLKMACTGELPPASDKGKTFIYDPQLANLAEVKAQIRLIFRTVSNKEITIIRSMQLTNLKDQYGNIKTSFKASESAIRIKDSAGTMSSMSHKCAEMDVQVPQLMGVSKAILDNVIFCHQDDSNWPLGTTSVLKAKFDDLFGATRFSKALKDLSDVRKKVLDTKKEKKHEADLAQQQVMQLQALRQQLAVEEATEAGTREKIEELRAVLKTLEDRICVQESKYAKLRSIEDANRAKLLQFKSLKSDIEALQASLSEIYEENLEELLALQEEFTKENSEIQEKIVSLESEIGDAEEATSKLTATLELYQAKAIESYKMEGRIVSARDEKKKVIQFIENRFSLRDLESSSCEEIFKCVNRQLQSAGKDEEFSSVEKIQKIEDQRRTSESKIASLRKKVLSLELQVEQSEKQLQEFEKKLEEVESVEAKEKELLKMLSACEDSEQSLQLSKIEALKEKLLATTKQLGLSNDKMIGLNATMEIQAKKRKEIVKNDMLREKLKALHEQAEKKKESLLSSSVKVWDNEVSHEQRLQEKPYRTKYVELNALIESIETTLKGCQTEFGSFDGQQGLHKQKIAQYDEELRKMRLDLLRNAEALSLEDFDLEAEDDVIMKAINLAELQAKSIENEARNELMIAQNANEIYRNFLTHSLKKRKCAFCYRDFSNDVEVENMKSKVKKKIDSLPEEISDMQVTHEDCTKRLFTYSLQKSCLNEFLRVRRLQKEAKHTSTNILPKKLEALKLNITHLEKERDGYKEKSSTINSMFSNLQTYQSLLDEIAEISREIRDFSSILRENGGDGALTSGDMKDEEDIESSDLLASIKSHRERLEELQKEKEHLNEQLRQLERQRDHDELKKKRLEMDLVANKEKMNELHEIKAKKAELATLVKQQRCNANENKELLAIEETENSLTVEEGDRLQLMLKEIRLDRSLKKEAFDRDFEKLKDLNKEIEAAEKFLSDYQDLMKKIKDVQQQKATMIGKLAKLKLDKGNLEEDAKKNNDIDETLRENLKLKRKRKEYEALESEIDSLKAGIGKDESTDMLKKEIDTLTEESTIMRLEIAGLEGSSKTRRESISAIKAKIKSPCFKDIEAIYQNFMISVETHEIAYKDLVNYQAALDKALMKYHSLKMQEINHSIKELWQTIYTGQDIDYIAIRSDTDSEGLSKADAQHRATPVGRSYNYRVVMLKGGNELEMRGRCSAGQKLLASLIIRLALAESFCMSCGILALDEPTTNLDESNIQNLAKALAALIEARRGNANFQLILITHDEDFVNQLAQQSLCDHYYRVGKNQEGESTIHQADIRCF